MTVEEKRLRESLEGEADDHHQKRAGDSYQRAFFSGTRVRGGELPGDYLNTILQVNPGNIETESVA